MTTANQFVFKRKELKYILTDEAKHLITRELSSRMRPDEHGVTVIRNLYYDTDSFRLIRRSVEKPIYKEKLRLRAYSRADADSPVFVELKKKYKGTVFKRRIGLPQEMAMRWLNGDVPCPQNTQISREIDSFLSFYGHLEPKVFLSYRREAFFSAEDPGFRVTFDRDISFRPDGLTLDSEPAGHPVLEDGLWLMELKCSGGMPLWMARLLSREKLYKTPFSKYGKAYTGYIAPAISKGELA